MSQRSASTDDELGEAVREALADIIAASERAPYTPRASSPTVQALWVRRVAVVAAGLVLIIGAIGLVAARIDTDPATTADSAAGVTTELPNDTPSSGSALLLPTEEIVPTYVQSDPAMPHRTYAALLAPDGSTIGVSQADNGIGSPSGEFEQRTLDGTLWEHHVGVNTYVTVDQCHMLVVNPGPSRPAWDPLIVGLLDAVDFSQQTSIDLPDNWELLAIDTAGDAYSLEFDPGLPDVEQILLQQTPSSNAGPLLAAFPAESVKSVTIAGGPAWQYPVDAAGWHHTIWNHGGGARMLSAKQALSPSEVEEVIDQLQPASPSIWHARFGNQDVGNRIARTTPACDPAKLTIDQ